MLLFVTGKTKARNCNYHSPLLHVTSSSRPGNLRAPARCSGYIFFIKLTAMFPLSSSDMEDAPHSCVGPVPNAGGPYWCVVRKWDPSWLQLEVGSDIHQTMSAGTTSVSSSSKHPRLMGFVPLGWCSHGFGQNHVSGQFDYIFSLPCLKASGLSWAESSSHHDVVSI